LNAWWYASKQTPPTLRVGRFGCDSLSLAGSRQRVKSRRSKVRLRLVSYTARFFLSRIAVGRAASNSSEGSQESETLPSATAPGRDSPAVLRSYVRLAIRGLRSRCSVQPTEFPASHRSPRSPLPFRLQFLRLHYNLQLATAAVLTRAKGRASVLLFVGQCLLPRDRTTSLQRPTVGRLPRPTALPPLLFVPVVSHGLRRR